MAVLYGSKPVHGLSFMPLLKEELYLVSPVDMPLADHQIALAQLQDVELLLPRPYNVMRKLVDEAFSGIHRVPTVVAEIESATTLVAAIANGLGATILPGSAARVVANACNARLSRIVEPVIEAPLAYPTLTEQGDQVTGREQAEEHRRGATDHHRDHVGLSSKLLATARSSKATTSEPIVWVVS